MHKYICSCINCQHFRHEANTGSMSKGSARLGRVQKINSAKATFQVSIIFCLQTLPVLSDFLYWTAVIFSFQNLVTAIQQKCK